MDHAGRPGGKGALPELLSQPVSVRLGGGELAKHSGLAYTFATAADRKRVAWILLLAGVGLGGIVCWKSLAGGAMVLAALLVFWDYWRRSRKYFGGLSGDLAGWFLQRVELWMLAAVWIVEWGAHLL